MESTKKKIAAKKPPKKASKELAIEVAEVISASPVEEKKSKSKPKKSDHEKALELANALLEKLENKKTWTKTDEAQLAKLNKIVAILSKLIPLEGKKSKAIAELSSDEDLEIIKHFLERKIARD